MCKEQAIILLADDDMDDQELLVEAINSIDAAIQVKTFKNGLDILDYLLTGPNHIPCLIVLDYNMPLASGLDVLEKIADNTRLQKVPRIVWSTSASPLFQEECLRTGAMKYVVKPNDVHTLHKIASEMIGVCCSS